MAKKDTVELVNDRIEQERSEAKDRLKELKKRGEPVTDENIAYFFPELHEKKEQGRLESWGNCPRIPLPHNLIVGLPSVFDLKPLEPDEFKSIHRIDIKTAEKLVERDLLLPNLLVRNPEEWKGHEHLNGLLEEAWVNGERVDHYLLARNGEYDDLFRSRREFLNEMWNMLDDDRVKRSLLDISGIKNYKDMPKVVGKRWAYLDVLEPAASRELEALFQQELYVDAFKYHRGVKHLFASPLTAALGGHFVWGPDELKKLKATERYGDTNISSLIEDYLPLSQRVFQHSEAIEYVLGVITRAEPFEVLQEWESQRLLKLLNNEQFKMLKQDIYRTLGAMVFEARKGGNPDPKFEDFKKMTKEFQGQLNNYQKRGKATVDGIFVAIGSLIGGCIGSITGGSLGSLAGYIIAASIPEEVKEQVGSVAHYVKNPDRHLIVVTLQQAKAISENYPL